MSTDKQTEAIKKWAQAENDGARNCGEMRNEKFGKEEERKRRNIFEIGDCSFI